MAILKKTLNEGLIAKLAVGRYSDAATPGLRLEVGKRARTFSMVYRRGDKTESFKIGRVDQGITLKQAREKAGDIQDQLAAGINPKIPFGSEADQQTVAVTFGRAWGRYKTEYLVHRRTGKSEAEFVDIHALDHFAPRLMASITKREAGNFMRATQRKITNRLNAKATQQGKLQKANAGHYAIKNLLKRLKAFYNWAIRVDLVDFNPFERIALELSTPSRKRVLNVEEILTVLDAVTRHKAPVYRNIVNMIISTGMRSGEVVELRFGWLNLEQGFASIPAHFAKNGQVNHVALPTQTVADLLTIRSEAIEVVGSAQNTNDLYVYSSGHNKRYWNFGKDKEKLNALLPESLEPFTLHDLRRSVATGLQRVGISRDVVERGILRHLPTGNDVLMQTYQLHEYVSEARDALDAWALHLTEYIEKRDKQIAQTLEVDRDIDRVEKWADENPEEYAKIVEDNKRWPLIRTTVTTNPLSQSGYGIRGNQHLKADKETQRSKGRLRKQKSREKQKKLKQTQASALD